MLTDTNLFRSIAFSWGFFCFVLLCLFVLFLNSFLFFSSSFFFFLLFIYFILFTYFIFFLFLGQRRMAITKSITSLLLLLSCGVSACASDCASDCLLGYAPCLQESGGQFYGCQEAMLQCVENCQLGDEETE